MMIVSTISYLCMLVGLGATAAYALSFYLIPYNELYLEGKSGHDEDDVPYTMAIVECAVSAATFILGVLAFAGPRPSKSVLGKTVVFFAILVAIEGSCGVIRAWNMGLFGDEMTRTCSDTQPFSGCPTSRFEAINHEIMYTSPSGGECSFWFWGPEMKTRFQFECPQYEPMCGHDIETYMDWSNRNSYGWREDPTAIAALLSDPHGTTTTVKVVNNMEVLMQLQTKYNRTIAPSAMLEHQPSLAYCWYWGCNAKCMSLRWSVNHWWLVSSFSLMAVHLINMFLALSLCKAPEKDDVAEATLVDYEKDDEEMLIEAPVIGRRRRALNKNPAMLRF